MVANDLSQMFARLSAVFICFIRNFTTFAASKKWRTQKSKTYSSACGNAALKRCPHSVLVQFTAFSISHFTIIYYNQMRSHL